jgi:3-deoxy-D-manno-octulosonic-acid transferase
VEKRKNTTLTKLFSVIYDLAIAAYGVAIKLSSAFSPKAKKWILGRRNWEEELSQAILSHRKRLLVHAASLGEMEQGIPILEELRLKFPDHQIIVSFFSPSGYENFNRRELCDTVIYLPLDRPSNAVKFAQLLKPELALFIKYEIWPNLIRELKKAGTKLVLAPANFRPDQIYFSGFSKKFFQQALFDFDTILVQNKKSLDLLKSIHYPNPQLCGDSRFDQAQANRNFDFHEKRMVAFLEDKKCLLIGSSWTQDERLVLKLLPEMSAYKIILAPHIIDPSNLSRIQTLFRTFGVSLYSQEDWLQEDQVLIVDNIGILKYLYRYANVAFIGGGFGSGVHSTVEAAVYQIPICFGPKHHKFPETYDLMEQDLARKIDNANDLAAFLRDSEETKPITFKNRSQVYLEQKQGASQQITKQITKLIFDGKS